MRLIVVTQAVLEQLFVEVDIPSDQFSLPMADSQMLWIKVSGDFKYSLSFGEP